jgi:membrane associated rhomboid family serine protease
MDSECEFDHQELTEWIALPQQSWGSNSLLPISRKKTAALVLVLDSQGIPCRFIRYGIGWQILVPHKYEAQAINQLSKYEAENKGWPPAPPKPNPLTENTLATVSVLLLLATFHNLTRLDISLFGYPTPDWQSVGSAKAASILHGEWWRLATSLTLHANLMHLVSNLAIGGIFIVFLCRELGSGLAWSLLLASGILGNYANAHFHLPTHSSVGSSTLIFGGVGILSAISIIRYRNHPRKRWFAPLAGAFALLASLGTEGVNTDLGAHFFGFLFGLLTGIAAAYLIETKGRPTKTANAFLALLSATVMLIAWWQALRSIS